MDLNDLKPKMKYFVMLADYSWAEVCQHDFALAGSDDRFINNTATLNSESFVDINVRNIGLDSLTELNLIIQIAKPQFDSDKGVGVFEDFKEPRRQDASSLDI